MWVSHIKLTNFRNFGSMELELPPGLVIICGDNAQGKTNLLEALYLLAIAKSYRAATERELVNWASATPASPAIVNAAVQREEQSLRVQIILQPSSAPPADAIGHEVPPFTVQKYVRVNGVPRRVSDLVGRVTAVLFTALDQDLVMGAPAVRRRYLDILLCQLEPEYLRALQRYQRTLTQRNHLLRQTREGGRQVASEFRFWEEELARSGAILIERRTRAMDFLSERAGAAHRELTGGGEALALSYAPSLSLDGAHQRAELEERLLQALEEQRGREVAAGLSLVGPHRDDIQFRVNGAAGGIYGSRGQARTIALALRLAEAEFLRQERGEEPVLLLDDVLSELDGHRRQHILEISTSYQQAIITTTDWDRIGTPFRSRAACFTLEGGQFSPLPAEFQLGS